MTRAASPPTRRRTHSTTSSAAAAAAVPTLTGSLDEPDPNAPPSECLEEAMGECGPLKGTCMPGGAPCCSAGGFCGTGDAYCGTAGFGGGMQPEYSNGKNLCGGQPKAGADAAAAATKPSAPMTVDSSASAAVDPKSYPEDVRCIDATYRLVNPDVCPAVDAVSTAPIAKVADAGMPGSSVVPEAAAGVPVDVVPSSPQDTLAAPPDGSAATVTPSVGGCKATNPTLTAAAQADWGLWCDNTCATRSNCATTELTGAAMCVCV